MRRFAIGLVAMPIVSGKVGGKAPDRDAKDARTPRLGRARYTLCAYNTFKCARIGDGAVQEYREEIRCLPLA